MSDLFEFAKGLVRAEADARHLPTLEEFSRRVEDLPVALNRCPDCGGQPLCDVDRLTARCSCGWSGRVLRKLP